MCTCKLHIFLGTIALLQDPAYVCAKYLLHFPRAEIDKEKTNKVINKIFELIL